MKGTLRIPATQLPIYQFTHYQLSESVFDKRHEIDKLRVGLGAGLRGLEHDRAERAGGDDGVRAGRLELLEPDVADSRPRLFLLVGEEQASARAAAERVFAISFRLADVGAESREQRAGLVHGPGVASEIAGIVESHYFGARINSGPLSSKQLLDVNRRVHDLDVVPELAVVVADRLHAMRA